MGKTGNIIIHQEKVQEAGDPADIIKVCPFDALELDGDRITINSACRVCKVCVKKYPEIFEHVEDFQGPSIDKDEWQGIVVYVEHDAGVIHPVTYELMGKARELADKVSQDLICLFIGNGIGDGCEELVNNGADKVFVYEDPGLEHFRIEPYAAVFSDFIEKEKPSVVLVGGTTLGRSLAPRVAARFRTGLTADCTLLDIQESTDLDQIRPAFGGNIMAHIRTPNHRPQFATVRYKIFDAPTNCRVNPDARIVKCSVDPAWLESGIEVLETREKPPAKGIEDANIIVVAGRGVKKPEDLQIIQDLADVLGGQLAATRPLIEAGWVDSRRQIGLSGRTVKPSLIITCGVSGSIQFRAGMSGAGTIMAINTDENAPIFSIAHYAIVGDLYKVVPALVEMLKGSVQDIKCQPDVQGEKTRAGEGGRTKPNQLDGGLGDAGQDDVNKKMARK